MSNISITLLGLFGGLNIGNEASLDQMVQTLRQRIPHVQLSCVSAHPEIVEQRLGIGGAQLAPPRFRWIALRVINRLLLRIPARIVQVLAAIKFMRNQRVVIVPGTGALDDFGWSPFGYPHDMLVWAFAARVQRANLFLVSIGAGPVRHPLSRIFFKLIAKNAVYRSFRDQESKDFANSIGIRSSRDYVFPDIVFSKEPPTSVDGIKHSQQGIGIGVMTYYGWSADQQKGKDIYSNYLIKLCAFVSWLIENGYNIRLLLGEQTDHSSIAAIQNNVRSIIKPIDNHRIKYNAIHNFSDLLHEISTTQIVVASRFHNVVASLMCGRPTISLGYSSKNTAIMKDFGLGEFCQNIEDFDIDILKAHFNKLIVAKHDISQKLIAKTKVLRTQLTLQERFLEKRIFEAGNI